jgi:hypothetical protein
LPAVAGLIGALQDEDREVRHCAALALCYVGHQAKAAIPALIEALKDPQPEVAGCAALALGHMGSDAKCAIPALLQTLKRRRKNSGDLAGYYALGAFVSINGWTEESAQILRRTLPEAHPSQHEYIDATIRELHGERVFFPDPD